LGCGIGRKVKERVEGFKYQGFLCTREDLGEENLDRIQIIGRGEIKKKS